MGAFRALLALALVGVGGWLMYVSITGMQLALPGLPALPTLPNNGTGNGQKPTSPTTSNPAPTSGIPR